MKSSHSGQYNISRTKWLVDLHSVFLCCSDVFLSYCPPEGLLQWGRLNTNNCYFTKPWIYTCHLRKVSYWSSVIIMIALECWGAGDNSVAKGRWGQILCEFSWDGNFGLARKPLPSSLLLPLSPSLLPTLQPSPSPSIPLSLPPSFPPSSPPSLSTPTHPPKSLLSPGVAALVVRYNKKDEFC